MGLIELITQIVFMVIGVFLSVLMTKFLIQNGRILQEIMGLSKEIKSIGEGIKSIGEEIKSLGEEMRKMDERSIQILQEIRSLGERMDKGFEEMRKEMRDGFKRMDEGFRLIALLIVGDEETKKRAFEKIKTELGL